MPWSRPLSINQPRDIALAHAYEYYNVLYQDDFFSLKDLGIRKNILTSNKLLKSYARNIKTQCSNSTIIKVVVIDDRTYEKYFEAIQRLFVIDEVMS